MKELSIIIPIYNTAPQALKRCLQSLPSLDPVSWEAVLVDDGSQDHVAVLCKRFAAQDSRIRYIRQENSGVSAARNRGLDQAQGRYVMFVDADDVLLGGPIVATLASAREELIFLDIQLEENGNLRTWPTFHCPAGPVDRQQVFEGLIATNDLNSPCARLISRDLLETHSIRFSTQFITGEDWLFISQIAQVAQCFRYVSQPCYRYCYTRATDRSRTLRFPDRVLDNCIRRYGKKQPLLDALPEDRRRALAPVAAAMLTEALFNTAADLMPAGLYTAPRQAQVRQAISGFSHLLPAMPKKSRMKADILLRFPAALLPAALARRAYLAVKR